MTTAAEKILSLVEAERSQVLKQGAFSDEPGNSVVYAAPSAPGLDAISFATAAGCLGSNEAVLELAIHILSPACSAIVGRESGFALVSHGSGNLNDRNDSKFPLSKGDVVVLGNEVSIQASRAEGLSMVSVFVSVGSEHDGISSRKLEHALRAEFCTCLPRAGKWRNRRGYRTLSAAPVTLNVLSRLTGAEEDRLLIGLNSVAITGRAPEEEGLHHHISSIFALAYSGEGDLMEPQGLRTPAAAGDAIVVPEGAPHYFESADSLVYGGLEFGPVGTDYQKHYPLV